MIYVKSRGTIMEVYVLIINAIRKNVLINDWLFNEENYQVKCNCFSVHAVFGIISNA
jgi:hypothetical protein